MEPRRRSLHPDLVLAGVAVGLLILVVMVVPATAGWGTTFAGGSTTALAADLAAGAALVLVGFLLREHPVDRALGVLAFGAAIAWFAADLSGWHDGPAAIRATSAVLAALLAPVLLHLSAAVPPGRTMSRGVTSAVVVGYAVVIPLIILAPLVTEPGVDGGCWRDCRSSPYLIAHVPWLAPLLRDALAVATLGCGLTMSAIAGVRLVRATRPARARLWPLLAATVVLGSTISGHAVRVLRDPVERPHDPLDVALFLLVAVAVVSFAGTLAWTVLRGRELIAALDDLARGAGAVGLGAEVRDRLSRAAGDPRLTVRYRVRDPDRWVDPEGVEVPEPVAGPERAVTPLVLGDQVIAAVIHDASILTPAELEAAIGPATRLAIDNERLRAGILAELAALQASRRSIVAAGDRERIRLERDLHDGAQQRLLALSYDLRMARAAALADGLESALPQLDAAIVATRTAHEELRELAHGIHPAILAEAGLGPALETLARRSPIPLEIDVDGARADPAAENAAYAVVAGAVRDAVAVGATHARATVRHAAERLEVTLVDDAPAERPLPDELRDRVGAAGGILSRPVTAAGRRLEAVIPCA